MPEINPPTSLRRPTDFPERLSAKPTRSPTAFRVLEGPGQDLTNTRGSTCGSGGGFLDVVGDFMGSNPLQFHRCRNSDRQTVDYTDGPSNASVRLCRDGSDEGSSIKVTISGIVRVPS